MIANDHDKFLRIKNRLKIEEGFKRFPYTDTKGKLTIGYGMNLTDVGIYPNEADFILANRMILTEDELVEKYPEYKNLDEVRQSVLLDMAFNIGVAGLLNFTHMLTCLADKNWTMASEAMRNSLWYKEVGHRGEFLAQMIETGIDH